MKDWEVYECRTAGKKCTTDPKRKNIPYQRVTTSFNLRDAATFTMSIQVATTRNHNVSRDLYDGKPIDSCLLFFRLLCSCQTCPDCHPAGVAAAVLEEPPAESQRERCRVNVFFPILSNIVIVHDRTFLLQHLMWGMHATLVAFTCFYTCFLYLFVLWRLPGQYRSCIWYHSEVQRQQDQHDLPKSHWKKMKTNHMTCQQIWNKSSTIGTNGQCWAKSGNQTKLESISS